MTYSLELDARALKEWQKSGDTVRQRAFGRIAGHAGDRGDRLPGHRTGQG